MADHNVKLNYAPTGHPPPNDVDFKPDVNPIRVRPGQTIAFSLGDGPTNGKIRLTFHNRHFFSTSNPKFAATGQFNDGDGDVHVTAPLAPGTRTTYHCELLVNGVVKAQSHENAGGDVEPDEGP